MLTERKPQAYLLRKEGTAYFLCKQTPEKTGFNHKGRAYDYKGMLYRIETAAKLGDTVRGENAELETLVREHARILEGMRAVKKNAAVERGVYITPG